MESNSVEHRGAGKRNTPRNRRGCSKNDAGLRNGSKAPMPDHPHSRTLSSAPTTADLCCPSRPWTREISSSAYGASYLHPTQIEPARRPICHSRAICKRKFDLFIPIQSHRFDLYTRASDIWDISRGVLSGEDQGQRRRLDGELGCMR